MTRDEVFEGVRAVLETILEVEANAVTPEARLAADLGADSLDVMEIVVRLNRRFGLKLSAKEVAEQLHEGNGSVGESPADGATAIPDDMESDGAAASVAERIGQLSDDGKIADLITVDFLVTTIETLVGAAPKMARPHQTASDHS